MWPFRNRTSTPLSAATPPESNPFRGVRVHLNDLIQARHHIGGLEGKRRTRSHALLAGGERSPFKGRGIDFEESRRYQSGDDVRLMDWRVTARTNEPHLKVFREERERPVFMVVDDRQTMHFGTKVAFKSVVAAQAAALLGWASHARGDRVGGVVFAEADHVELRPKGGRSGILQLLNVLANRSGPSLTQNPEPGSSATSFRLALNRVLKAARPGSLIFLFSDFREWDQQAKTALRRLGAHHEVVALFIYDQVEQVAPPPGSYPITDGQAQGALQTHSSQVVAAYSKAFQARYEEVRGLCRSRGIGFVPLVTHEDLPTQLTKGLQELGNRRSANHSGVAGVA
ncbi:MAG: DUF58 domain-containing protein [Nitrospirota bacterium]|nr:DUF58 domain-containing protein [Nitrospirota bacterium]